MCFSPARAGLLSLEGSGAQPSGPGRVQISDCSPSPQDASRVPQGDHRTQFTERSWQSSSQTACAPHLPLSLTSRQTCGPPQTSNAAGSALSDGIICAHALHAQNTHTHAAAESCAAPHLDRLVLPRRCQQVAGRMAVQAHDRRIKRRVLLPVPHNLDEVHLHRCRQALPGPESRMRQPLEEPAASRRAGACALSALSTAVAHDRLCPRNSTLWAVTPVTRANPLPHTHTHTRTACHSAADRSQPSNSRLNGVSGPGGAPSGSSSAGGSESGSAGRRMASSTHARCSGVRSSSSTAATLAGPCTLRILATVLASRNGRMACGADNREHEQRPTGLDEGRGYILHENCMRWRQQRGGEGAMGGRGGRLPCRDGGVNEMGA